MEERIKALETRVDALVESLAHMQKNQTSVTVKADASSNKIPQIDANTEGVVGNEDAVCELSELVDASIAELEQAICDLSEEIGG